MKWEMCLKDNPTKVQENNTRPPMGQHNEKI